MKIKSERGLGMLDGTIEQISRCRAENHRADCHDLELTAHDAWLFWSFGQHRRRVPVYSALNTRRDGRGAGSAADEPGWSSDQAGQPSPFSAQGHCTTRGPGSHGCEVSVC